MSVLIKDMEKPKSCYAVDEESEYCPLVNADDDCILLLKKGICGLTWKEQYGKCPLVEEPEPCEDAVSRRKAFEYFVSLWECIGTIMDREEWEDVCKTTANELPSVTPKCKAGK